MLYIAMFARRKLRFVGHQEGGVMTRGASADCGVINEGSTTVGRHQVLGSELGLIVWVGLVLVKYCLVWLPYAQCCLAMD